MTIIPGPGTKLGQLLSIVQGAEVGGGISAPTIQDASIESVLDYRGWLRAAMKERAVQSTNFATAEGGSLKDIFGPVPTGEVWILRDANVVSTRTSQSLCLARRRQDGTDIYWLGSASTSGVSLWGNNTFGWWTTMWITTTVHVGSPPPLILYPGESFAVKPTSQTGTIDFQVLYDAIPEWLVDLELP